MYDNFDGPGFDFDHNGTDDYIDYQMSSGGGGGSSGGSGGSGQPGCGTILLALFVVYGLLNMLFSCS